MDFDELDELDPVEVADPDAEERKYDIVVHGATGFTGTLIVEHLDALTVSSGAQMKWAIAGRSMDKLMRMSLYTKSKPRKIEVNSVPELNQMVSETRVVIAAAGPYHLIGEDLVRACVNSRTHYIDISGEVTWIRKMIDRYHARAKEQGVMIVHAAGAVCSPDEILCHALVKKLGPLKQYREYFQQYGATSGGTFNTGLTSMASMTEEDFKVMRDPFSLGGARERGVSEADQDCAKVEQDPLFPALHLSPAYNSVTGSRIIRRSCELFEATPSDGVAYGKDLAVTIRGYSANKKASESMVQQAGPLPSLEMAQFAHRQMADSLARGEVPNPGLGPPPETRKNYFAEVHAVAEGENGRWAFARYTSGEGYEVTAMAAATGALCLLEERAAIKPKERGGVVTPAYAFHGSTWVDRLCSASFGTSGGRKVTLEVKDGKPEEEDLKRSAGEVNKASMAGMAQLMKGELKGWDLPALVK